jgi:AAA domain
MSAHYPNRQSETPWTDAEISAPVADEIASWRRVFAARRNGVDARDLLRRAAAELWQVLEIDKTAHPESHGVARQDAIDALQEMAESSGIGPDDAQLIFAESFKSPASNGDAREHKSGGKTWRGHVVTAAELQRKQFPPISYVVPGLIPEGLSILAGRPKVGKSWLALDVGIAVAAERICLGDCRPAPGDVLYAALEDNPRRLQRRIDKICHPSARTGRSD